MSTERTPDNLEVQTPRDLIALSRTILHVANLGTPRFEFLHRVSGYLLQFTHCDRLEIRLHGPELSFRWLATARPRRQFGYQRHDPSPPSPVDRLLERIAGGDVEAAAPCITKHGTFWTGELWDTLSGFGEGPAEPDDPHSYIRSLLAIPFDVGIDDRCSLLLASAQPDFFRAESIELFESVAQTLALAIADRRSQAALRERVKELSCLYRLSQIKADSDTPFEQRLQRIVDDLPNAWQYPENAVATIELDDAVYATESFDAVRHAQTAPITINGTTRGRVVLGYLGDRPEFAEGAFLPEEQSLIETVARELSLFVERTELGVRHQRLEQQLRHADRLTVIGKLAAGVAHEINEPLGAILGFAQLIRKAPGLPAEQSADVEKIINASLHAREIVRKLVLFARQQPLKPASLSLNETIAEALSMVKLQLMKTGIEVVTRLAGDLPRIMGDAVQLRQVVLNLVLNSIQAMAQGGTLTITTRADLQDAMLGVEDTGIGIDRDRLNEIFTPFYTTKEVGVGTGLGLPVVHGIVSAHGGTITVKSELGKGARFDVRLPLERGYTEPQNPRMSQ